jgi:hypothetical protein
VVLREDLSSDKMCRVVGKGHKVTKDGFEAKLNKRKPRRYIVSSHHDWVPLGRSLPSNPFCTLYSGHRDLWDLLWDQQRTQDPTVVMTAGLYALMHKQRCYWAPLAGSERGQGTLRQAEGAAAAGSRQNGPGSSFGDDEDPRSRYR